MRKKDSYRLLWNIFLFIVCSGSVALAWMEHRKMANYKAQVEYHKAKADSVLQEAERMQRAAAEERLRAEEALRRTQETEKNSNN